jgi:hypothetical protein
MFSSFKVFLSLMFMSIIHVSKEVAVEYMFSKYLLCHLILHYHLCSCNEGTYLLLQVNPTVAVSVTLEILHRRELDIIFSSLLLNIQHS